MMSSRRNRHQLHSTVKIVIMDQRSGYHECIALHSRAVARSFGRDNAPAAPDRPRTLMSTDHDVISIHPVGLWRLNGAESRVLTPSRVKLVKGPREKCGNVQLEIKRSPIMGAFERINLDTQFTPTYLEAWLHSLYKCYVFFHDTCVHLPAMSSLGIAHCTCCE
jgi:hypothetical protein